MQPSQDLLVVGVGNKILEIIHDVIKQCVLLDQIAVLLHGEVGPAKLPPSARDLAAQHVVLWVGIQPAHIGIQHLVAR